MDSVAKKKAREEKEKIDLLKDDNKAAAETEIGGRQRLSDGEEAVNDTEGGGTDRE